MSIADNLIFHDPTAARKWLERLLWPEGPVCPHCGLIGAAYKLNGKKQRPGLYKCKGCEEQFTVTVGTIFERSHIPLNKLGSGISVDGCQQERHVGPPAAPHARRNI